MFVKLIINCYEIILLIIYSVPTYDVITNKGTA